MKRLVLLVAVLFALSSVASALPIISGVVRSGGSSGNRGPIGSFDGDDSPWLTSLADGIYVFCDRDNFKLQSTPIDLVGADYVQTFNTDKTVTTVTYDVTTSMGAIVAVGLDDRFAPNQQAMIDAITALIGPTGTFQDTGYDLTTTEGTPQKLSLFATPLPAGTYRFYGTNNTSNNFMVIGAMIPEPATIALLGFGTLALIRKKR
jgi:hypothetical protein